MPTTTCPSCYQNQCPEVPDITIIEAPVVDGGAGATVCTHRCRNENFSIGAGTITNGGDGYRYLTVAYLPILNSLLVFKNGVSQDTDAYTLYGKIVRLNTIADGGDKYQLYYWTDESTTGTTSMYPLTGSFMQMNDAVTELPGYLLCDGTTARNKADYAALWVYLVANPTLVESSTTDTFTLKDMSFLVQQGETLVTMNTFIKT